MYLEMHQRGRPATFYTALDTVRPHDSQLHICVPAAADRRLFHQTGPGSIGLGPGLRAAGKCLPVSLRLRLGAFLRRLSHHRADKAWASSKSLGTAESFRCISLPEVSRPLHPPRLLLQGVRHEPGQALLMALL